MRCLAALAWQNVSDRVAGCWNGGRATKINCGGLISEAKVSVLMPRGFSWIL